jgi:hypothetical protein
MALTMRPTRLGHGVYKDDIDFGVFSGEWELKRSWRKWLEWAMLRERSSPLRPLRGRLFGRIGEPLNLARNLVPPGGQVGEFLFEIWVSDF